MRQGAWNGSLLSATNGQENIEAQALVRFRRARPEKELSLKGDEWQALDLVRVPSDEHAVPAPIIISTCTPCRQLFRSLRTKGLVKPIPAQLNRNDTSGAGV